MTQDEIIRMAREAGYQSVYLSDAPIGRSYQFLERFAALVAAHAKSEQINLAYQQGYEEGSAHEREKAKFVFEELEREVKAELINAINGAVELEREACAKLVEITHAKGLQSIREACAAAIRARGGK